MSRQAEESNRNLAVRLASAALCVQRAEHRCRAMGSAPNAHHRTTNRTSAVLTDGWHPTSYSTSRCAHRLRREMDDGCIFACVAMVFGRGVGAFSAHRHLATARFRPHMDTAATLRQRTLTVRTQSSALWPSAVRRPTNQRRHRSFRRSPPD